MELEPIQLVRPMVGAEEEHAVLQVLKSGMLVMGETVERFERGLAQVTQRTEAVAVANGTAALVLALRALSIGPGDEVLCPNLTWPSPVHAVLELGATPVLVDVQRKTWNVDAAALVAARTARTRAAIVIDQFGNPAPTSAIEEAMPGLPIVVDAACSLGSTHDGRPAGSLGVVACMSFHPRKVLTTGEGGVCLTDDPALADRIRALRNHGQSIPGNFTVPSTNHRLTEVAAALGCVQLGRLDEIVALRRQLAARYQSELPPALTLQQPIDGAVANHQTLGVLLPRPCTEQDRDRYIASLRDHGVNAGRLSYALHKLPHLAQCRRHGDLAESASIAQRGLALPLYPTMTTHQQTRVLQAVHAAMESTSL